MAFNFVSLPDDLGKISFNGCEYAVVTIMTYADGKQIIELKNMYNGDKETMIYYKTDFDY